MNLRLIALLCSLNLVAPTEGSLQASSTSRGITSDLSSYDGQGRNVIQPRAAPRRSKSAPPTDRAMAKASTTMARQDSAPTPELTPLITPPRTPESALRHATEMEVKVADLRRTNKIDSQRDRARSAGMQSEYNAIVHSRSNSRPFRAHQKGQEVLRLSNGYRKRMLRTSNAYKKAGEAAALANLPDREQRNLLKADTQMARYKTAKADDARFKNALGRIHYPEMANTLEHTGVGSPSVIQATRTCGLLCQLGESNHIRELERNRREYRWLRKNGGRDTDSSESGEE